MDDASSPFAAFRFPDFRRLVLVGMFGTLGNRALQMIIAYEIYEQTSDVHHLGWLGLAGALPAIGIGLFGGHLADRMERRAILRTTTAILFTSAATICWLSHANPTGTPLVFMYGAVVFSSFARGFAEPAIAALEAQLLAREIIVRASVMLAACRLACFVLGPIVAGVLLACFNPTAAYAFVAGSFFLAFAAASVLSPRPVPPPTSGESIWQSIGAGLKYVMGNQILLGSMSLDLFAVLFGGATALLPAFAKDILEVDPIGLGMLRASSDIGTFLTLLWATRHPPIHHAGRNLFLGIVGFGVCIIVFALSTNFYLSLLALTLSGVCDGVSVVVRRAIVRLASPNHLRGRIAAVSMIFIGSSNEIGALESGLAAAWLGLVPSVWAGGLVTLLIVVATARLAPNLRKLSLK